jgi:hypothetical protein
MLRGRAIRPAACASSGVTPGRGDTDEIRRE